MELQQSYQWLKDNEALINHSVKFKGDELTQFFNTYNTITGENKTRSLCGRCIMNMKHRLQKEIKKINLMKQYPVYRTSKGNLTLRPNKQGQVSTIWANTRDSAKQSLEVLKQKEENEKISE